VTNQPYPDPDPRPACPSCGMRGTLVPQSREIKQKQRVKFGVFYVLLTFVFGLGLILWLVTPRRNRVVSVDRYNRCSNCGVETR
jgi:hypothetical protein